MTDPQTTERVRRGVSFIQLSNLSLLLSNWSGVIEKRGKLSARQAVAPSRAMKLPLPSITSLEVKDAGKLRRRNRPAQLMTAVGHFETKSEAAFVARLLVRSSHMKLTFCTVRSSGTTRSGRRACFQVVTNTTTPLRRLQMNLRYNPERRLGDAGKLLAKVVFGGSCACSSSGFAYRATAV